MGGKLPLPSGHGPIRRRRHPPARRAGRARRRRRRPGHRHRRRRAPRRPPCAPGHGWLGHPLHPLLTDLPIGFWTSAFVLDLVGGPGSRDASRQLVAWGVVSAVPTAAAGLADWPGLDRAGPAHRAGARRRQRRRHRLLRAVVVGPAARPPARRRGVGPGRRHGRHGGRLARRLPGVRARGRSPPSPTSPEQRSELAHLLEERQQIVGVLLLRRRGCSPSGDGW